jgi:hypothetical protein
MLARNDLPSPDIVRHKLLFRMRLVQTLRNPVSRRGRPANALVPGRVHGGRRFDCSSRRNVSTLSPDEASLVTSEDLHLSADQTC